MNKRTLTLLKGRNGQFRWTLTSGGNCVGRAPDYYTRRGTMCRILATSVFPHELRWRKPVGGKERLVVLPKAYLKLIDLTRP